MEYSIQILDAQRRILKIIDQFKSIELVLRFNQISRYVVVLPFSEILGNLGLTWSNSMRILRDGVELISGEIETYQRDFGQGSNIIILSGSSPEKKLKGRLALPVPGGPPYTSAAYDVRSGPAETVIKGYVNANAGPGAAVARRVSGLTVEGDGRRGQTITGRARFHTLLPFIQALAVQGGVGFRFSGMEFQIYLPSDKTNQVVFDVGRGNLASFTYRSSPAESNYLYVGGSGVGTARTIYEAGDFSSIQACGRMEMFLDQRQTTSSEELQQKALEELVKKAALVELTAAPVQLPGLKPWVHYNLGDQVTAVIDGKRVSAIIREIGVKVTERGEELKPVIGSYRATGSGLFSILKKDADERIETLEIV